MVNRSVIVGRIGRAHGILGEATIEVRTDSPELRFAIGARLETEPSSRGPLTVRSSRWHNSHLLLAFEGVHDRNGIEALRDTLLRTEIDIAGQPFGDDDYHVLQLIGCSVVDQTGALIGEVSEVINLPGQDLLEVTRAQPHTSQILIPFVREIVPGVDITARKITINPPAGLIVGGDEK